MQAYSADPKPLKSYAVMVGVFNVALGAGLLVSRDLPKRSSLTDVLLLGVATHKYSRLLTKDRVTSVMRAPFVRYLRDAGPGEVEEEARGGGVQHAVGELLVCPYCAGLWIATALGFGMAWQPGRTRFVLNVGTALAISDFLHHGLKAAEERS
jgi:Protein of unknown function (DUF1360)